MQKLASCNLASFGEFWRVVASSTSIYAKVALVLAAQMASHIVQEKFWLASVASKIPRMHAGSVALGTVLTS